MNKTYTFSLSITLILISSVLFLGNQSVDASSNFPSYIENSNYPVKQRVVTIDGQGKKIDISDLSFSSEQIQVLKIINAPNTVIKNRVTSNMRIEVINSPGTQIINNSFSNLNFQAENSVIRVYNSSNSKISDNKIVNSKFSYNPSQTTLNVMLKGISLELSRNSSITKNTIQNLNLTQLSLSTSQAFVRNFVYGIDLLYSDHVEVNSNNISKLSVQGEVNRAVGIHSHQSNFTEFSNNSIHNFGVEKLFYSAYTSGMFIENQQNTTIRDNKFSDLFASGDSLSTGITLFKTTNIVIKDNLIDKLLASTLIAGVLLVDSTYGKISNNRFSNFLETKSKSNNVNISISAVNLQNSNFFIIQQNLATNIPTFSILDGKSANNIITNNVLDTQGVNNQVYPKINSQPLISYPAGDTTFRVVTWIIIDTDPATYKIFHNGTLIKDGWWSSGVPIILNVTDLPLGLHNFTLVASDSLNHFSVSTAIVRVYKNSNPRNFYQPPDLLKLLPKNVADKIRNFFSFNTLIALIQTLPITVALFFLFEYAKRSYKKRKSEKVNNSS